MGFRTQRDVDRLTLPPGKSELVEADEDTTGLYVRLQGEAPPVWRVRYTLPSGRRRWMNLEPVKALSLADARKRAAKIVNEAKDGRDPQEERATKKRQAADTFGALVALYMARYAERHQQPKTRAETKRALEVHLKPLHGRPVGEINRRDVAARLQELVDSSGPIMANRTRAALSGCYAWAMQQGLADTNPVVGSAPPAPEVKRERVLNANEMRLVWHAAGDDDYGRIVKVLLLTGQRRDEVGSLAELEIVRHDSLWMLPGARTKNGLAHEVPLALPVLKLIGPARDGRSKIFGRGKNGFSGWSQSKARLDARITRARAEARLGRKLKPDEAPAAEDALPRWTLHDLRRTFVTTANEMGIAPPHIVEAVCNHVSGHRAGVAGTYNHAKYRSEKRAALDAWGAHVEALVSGRKRAGNVVKLRRRGR